MSKPEFQQIEPDLWFWKDWAIAFAYGSFWLMTSAAGELGPFQYFDEAFVRAAELS